MRNWTRIKEVYDGGFTEMYLDLYNCETGFVIKGISYHYNAGAEKKLCEVEIPGTVKSTEDVLNFIAKNNSLYPWARITLNEIKTNDQLIAFIAEHR